MRSTAIPYNTSNSVLLVIPNHVFYLDWLVPSSKGLFRLYVSNTFSVFYHFILGFSEPTHYNLMFYNYCNHCCLFFFLFSARNLLALRVIVVRHIIFELSTWFLLLIMLLSLNNLLKPMLLNPHIEACL